MERAGLDVVADAGAAQPPAQLAGGLPGERQGQGVAGVGRADRDAVGDAPCQHAGLAGPGAGDDGDERRRRRHRGELIGCQPVGRRWRGSHSLHSGHPTRADSTVGGVPYPRKLLNDNETIVLDLHPHWWYFVEAAVALVASIAFAIVVLAAGWPSGVRWLALALVVAHRRVARRPLRALADDELRRDERPGDLPPRRCSPRPASRSRWSASTACTSTSRSSSGSSAPATC